MNILFCIPSYLYSQQNNLSADTLSGDYYFELGEKFFKEGDYDSSTFYYDKAAGQFKLSKRWQDYILSRNYQGINLRYLSRYDESYRVLKEALAICLEKLGNSEPLLADVYNSIGSYFYETAELDSAFTYYNNSLNLSLSSYGENHRNTARGFHNLGLIFYWQMDSQRALLYFEKALSIWIPLVGEQHSSIGNCYLNIANAYFLMEDFDRAIEYALKSLDVWKSVLGDEHQYIAMAYNNLSDTYETIGKYKEAIENDEKGLALRRKIYGDRHIETANSLAHIASIYSKTGEFEKARQYFNEAFSIFNQYTTSNPYNLQALLALAELNLNEGKLDDALKNCDTVLNYTIPEVLKPDFLADTLDITLLRTELLKAIFIKGEIYFNEYYNKENISSEDNFSMKQNFLLDSYKWFKIYNEILEKIKGEFRNETSKLFLNKSKYVTINKLIDISFKLYELTGEYKFKEEAFVFSEKSKAETLYDAIIESNAKYFSGIDERFLTEEKLLKTKKTFLETKLLEFENEHPQLIEALEIKKDLFAINEKYDSLVNFFESNFPEYYKLKFDKNIPNIAEIQSFFSDEESVLLEYFIGDSITFIYLIDKNNFIISKSNTSEVINHIIKFRNALQNLDYSAYILSAGKLYSLLIQPIEKFLNKKKRIFVIPDGVALYLPFEALLTGNSKISDESNFRNLPYLLNQYEVVYNYSVKLLLNRRLKSNNEKFSFLGFAPVFVDETIEKNKIRKIIDPSLFAGERSKTIKENYYSPLPESDFEITEISKLFISSGLVGKIYKFKDASEFNLKSDALSEYNCLHFATHGYINESNPKLSCLIFSSDSVSGEDGILYSEEIFNLHLNAKLVVLSACESGLGKIIRGEGILGLTRGFLYSGAENIIVSLWRVADKSTSIFMLKFYQKLLQGNSCSSALRGAKLEMIKEGTYSYPLEWSPFILIGR